MDRDSKLVLDVMPDVFPKCPDRVAVEFRIDTFIIVYADISEFIPNPFCGDFLCIRSVRIRDDVAVMTHHVLVMEIRHQAALDFIASVCNLVDFRLDGDRVLRQRVDSP